MKLFVIILKKSELLDDLLLHFAKEGIHGATILDSTGMAQLLAGKDGVSFFEGLKAFLDDEIYARTKTVLTVVKDYQIGTINRVVDDVLGDLSQPNTAVMFSLPVDSARGFA